MVSASLLQSKRANPDAKFLQLSMAVRRALWRLAEDVFKRVITPDEFGERAAAILQEGHARAAQFGRVRAGLLGPINDNDRLFADAVMRDQSTFLQRFVNDLSGTRYLGDDGEYIRAPVNQRLQLYAARMRGTANESFAMSSEGALFEWILIAEDNCNDCPTLAGGGPYTAASLPTHPGSGDTQCLSNCKCLLLREDGVLGPIYPYTEAGDEPL